MLLLQRRFMRRLGPMLASFIAGGGVLGCASPGSGAGDASGRHASWDRLRQGWLQLRGITLETDCDARKEAHREVLDELVAAGELDATVADRMQRAFSETVDHRQDSLVSCYAFMPLECIVRQDLVEQTEVLEQVGGDLDAAVLEKVRAAIARDVAFFGAAKDEETREVFALYESGEIETSPEDVEAARILAALLLGRAEG